MKTIESPKLPYLLIVLCIAPLVSGCFQAEILYSSIEPRPKIKRWTIKHEGHKLECYSKKGEVYPMSTNTGAKGFLRFDGIMFPMNFEYYGPGNAPNGEAIRLPEELKREHPPYKPQDIKITEAYLIVPAEKFDSEQFKQLSNLIGARYPEIMALTKKHCVNLARRGSFHPTRHLKVLYGTIRKPTETQQ